MFSRPRRWALVVFYGLSPVARAFPFTASAPTQCDPFSISWTGGTPPFQLLLAPAFGSFRNISIPAESFSDGKGSFSLQLPLAEKTRFVATMSDATGYATGGTTDLLTTGPSRGGSCNITDPGIDFPFELNSALQQCRPYIISGYDKAIQPVTIIGTVPGGTSFILRPPLGSASFIWNANAAAGTSLLFTMVDAAGRNGGTSDVKTVGITDDSTCLTGAFPSSTAPSSTATTSTNTRSPSDTSSPPPSSSSQPQNNTSIAAIAGTVIGALVFLAVAVTMGLFCLRKRRDASRGRSHAELDLTYDPTHAPSNYPYPSGAAAASASPLPLIPGSGAYDANPFTDSPHPQPAYQQSQYGSTSQFQSPSQYQGLSQYQPSQYQPSNQSLYASSHQPQHSFGSDADPFNPYTLTHGPPPPVIQPFDLNSSDQSSSRDSMTTTQRKAALAGVTPYTPQRFIVHTDVEDELPPPNPDGIVELPPQYSERRAPLAPVAQASSSYDPTSRS
ncbi:putative protein Coprinopsis cinerea okayama7 130 [Lyophyllum shimeji]|uniref:Uncharacterized protein n=1 Tax=Lyophyllum shimeji TaxID=47721 RepID=A0A9P3UIV4_LYOSH|nr:putative protein Coprinopsis cinerea okayama7 130 [Lyophyllum shimeji]